MLLRYSHSILRLHQIRPSHHQLHTPCVHRPLQDSVEVVIVYLFTMMYSSEYRVPKVNAHLGSVSTLVGLVRSETAC